MRSSPASFVILILVGSCVCCGQAPRVQPPLFDGNRAFTYLRTQVEFGPRVPGSDASARCRDYIYDHFRGLGLVVDSQVFVFRDPYSDADVRMVNVVGSYDPANVSAAARIVLMAHYDSRPRAEYARDPNLAGEPIDGANDGASGTAVLMEMANLIARDAPPGAVDLVLVDGEDWGVTGDHERYMLGSRHFARQGIRGKYRFGIVVDMVGDIDQRILREGYSEIYGKSLNDMVWRSARELGIDAFYDSIGDSVLDDHLSLNVGGVPSINIIDFDYPYWHTEFDTPDKCSGLSLANVGRVLTEIIYNPSLWPEK
ncbi:MAG: M28 family peptidase [Candidatus Zixiibacteriota bacterium]|nr:MAG: M28 family peptidase [candidate division Zixibacteria bacterium]